MEGPNAITTGTLFNQHSIRLFTLTSEWLLGQLRCLQYPSGVLSGVPNGTGLGKCQSPFLSLIFSTHQKSIGRDMDTFPVKRHLSFIKAEHGPKFSNSHLKHVIFILRASQACLKRHTKLLHLAHYPAISTFVTRKHAPKLLTSYLLL